MLRGRSCFRERAAERGLLTVFVLRDVVRVHGQGGYLGRVPEPLAHLHGVLTRAQASSLHPSPGFPTNAVHISWPRGMRPPVNSVMLSPLVVKALTVSFALRPTQPLAHPLTEVDPLRTPETRRTIEHAFEYWGGTRGRSRT